jgi:hypothetical protein
VDYGLERARPFVTGVGISGQREGLVMRLLFAALALAGASIPFAPAKATESVTRVAQMARDVTYAVRRQRAQSRERPCRDDNRQTGSKR